VAGKKSWRVNSRGEVRWAWCARENGYARLPDIAGLAPPVQAHVDYSALVVQTVAQTTHINSAQALDRARVAFTLFVQGGVFVVDRQNGRPRRLVSDMDRPHAVRRSADYGWSVCDTGNNTVVRLDPDFVMTDEVTGDFDWVQDAVWLNGRVILIDANHYRVVEVAATAGEVVRELGAAKTLAVRLDLYTDSCGVRMCRGTW
jgi:hypothetical protein